MIQASAHHLWKALISFQDILLNIFVAMSSDSESDGGGPRRLIALTNKKRGPTINISSSALSKPKISGDAAAVRVTTQDASGAGIGQVVRRWGGGAGADQPLPSHSPPAASNNNATSVAQNEPPAPPPASAVEALSRTSSRPASQRIPDLHVDAAGALRSGPVPECAASSSKVADTSDEETAARMLTVAMKNFKESESKRAAQTQGSDVALPAKPPPAKPLMPPQRPTAAAAPKLVPGWPAAPEAPKRGGPMPPKMRRALGKVAGLVAELGLALPPGPHAGHSGRKRANHPGSSSSSSSSSGGGGGGAGRKRLRAPAPSNGNDPSGGGGGEGGGEGGDRCTGDRRARDGAAAKRERLLPACFGSSSVCFDVFVAVDGERGLGLKLKAIEGKAVVRGFAPWRTPAVKGENGAPEVKATLEAIAGRSAGGALLGQTEVRVNDVIVSVNNLDARGEPFTAVVAKIRDASQAPDGAGSAAPAILCIRFARPLILDELVV